MAPATGRFVFLPTLAACLLLAVSPLWAAARVELEVVGEARTGTPMDFQQWLQILSRAGVKNVRFRTLQPGDEVKIDTRGAADSRVYVVTGQLAGDVLIVPGRASSGPRRPSWPNGSTTWPRTARPTVANPARPSG